MLGLLLAAPARTGEEHTAALLAQGRRERNGPGSHAVGDLHVKAATQAKIEPYNKQILPRTSLPPESEYAELVAGMDEETKTCFDLLVDYPYIMVLSTGVLWCPAAKVGSTTIFHTLGMQRHLAQGAYSGPSHTTQLRLKDGNVTEMKYQQAREMSFPERKAACEAPHVTFTMTRDPFDRLTSCYLDKVVFQEKWPCKANDLLPPNATFEDFIDVLVGLPIEEHDAHTMPFSYRCGVDKYNYNLIGHLEKFDDTMVQLYEKARLGEYVPHHEKDAGKARTIENLETLRRFGLSEEVLHMHGAERVDYFYTPMIKEKVANSHWKTDVQMFSSVPDPALGSSQGSLGVPSPDPSDPVVQRVQAVVNKLHSLHEKTTDASAALFDEI
jgi:hypothetical protein